MQTKMPSNDPNRKSEPDSVGNLEPHERLRLLSNHSTCLEVDPNIHPKRYYQSGLEMVRMANVYRKEGSLEHAYTLYLKFMTLFIEKIRNHPEFASVPSNIKATNAMKLREVLPLAEELKKVLLNKYNAEYSKYLEDQQKRKEMESRRKAQEIKDLKKPSTVSIAETSWTKIEPVPDIDTVRYPDEEREEYGGIPVPHSSSTVPKPPISITENRSEDRSGVVSPKNKPESLDIRNIPKPSIDRSLKPASLLTPSAPTKIGNRDVLIPSQLVNKFLMVASRNTFNNIETCGVLAGKLEYNQLKITHVIISKQEGTSDTCNTYNEEEIFDYQDQHNLITLGWIHTHPSQTAFLSSIDVHTQCSYQIMMPEAIAIVCAPKYQETGIFVLTMYGLELISECRKTGFHPHPRDPVIFAPADHTKFDSNTPVEIIDLR